MNNMTTYETKLTIHGSDDFDKFRDFVTELFEHTREFCDSNSELIKYSAIINDDKNIVKFTTETQNERLSKELTARIAGCILSLVPAKALGLVEYVENELKSTLKLG